MKNKKGNYREYCQQFIDIIWKFPVTGKLFTYESISNLISIATIAICPLVKLLETPFYLFQENLKIVLHLPGAKCDLFLTFKLFFRFLEVSVGKMEEVAVTSQFVLLHQ